MFVIYTANDANFAETLFFFNNTKTVAGIHMNRYVFSLDYCIYMIINYYTDLNKFKLDKLCKGTLVCNCVLYHRFDCTMKRIFIAIYKKSVNAGR